MSDTPMYWCEHCKSYHADPKDLEHAAMLICMDPKWKTKYHYILELNDLERLEFTGTIKDGKISAMGDVFDEWPKLINVARTIFRLEDTDTGIDEDITRAWYIPDPKENT